MQTTSYKEGWSCEVGAELQDNMNIAYKRVKSNKGSHGVNGMKVDELLPNLEQHGKALIASILEGTYRPKPVRCVEMKKPEGGIKLLRIPTVVDRMVQQAVTKAKEYMEQGHKWVVDIDLAKYFDTVNHDKLMSLVAREITNRSVLKLI